MTTDPSTVVFAPQVVSQKAVEVVERRAATLEQGIKTGISPLDAVQNPLRPGELVVVLGYTSNYKSGVMNNIARHRARVLKRGGLSGKRAVFTFTWEQSIEEQGILDIAQLQCLDATKMMRGEMSDTDWVSIRTGATKRGALPWWLVGHSSEDKARRPRLSMSEVYNTMEYIADKQQVTPDMIVLDYLQRIRREGNGETREQFMAMVDQAKDLALAFGCPVMLGTQASRKVKERRWQLPQPEDGQETSNLEQSADALWSVWMPIKSYAPGTFIEYGEKSWEVNKNLLIFGVMKQKLGPAPEIFPLYVRPEVNLLCGMVDGQADLQQAEDAIAEAR